MPLLHIRQCRSYRSYLDIERFIRAPVVKSRCTLLSLNSICGFETVEREMPHTHQVDTLFARKSRAPGDKAVTFSAPVFQRPFVSRQASVSKHGRYGWLCSPVHFVKTFCGWKCWKRSSGRRSSALETRAYNDVVCHRHPEKAIRILARGLANCEISIPRSAKYATVYDEC